MIMLRAALAEQWQRRIAAAGACALLGMFVAATGERLPALFSAAALGTGILGASLLLAWAIDAAEVDLSGRLVIMMVALVAALPELTVEVHLAFTQQAQFVTANITGATRLLLTAAIAMPPLGAVLLRSRGESTPPVVLNPARRLDLAVLLVAALWALIVVARGRLTLIDGLIFGALYLLYALRGRDTDEEQPAPIGVAAEIASLDTTSRRRLCGALFVLAALAVVVTSRAFPGELLRAGQSLGIDPYLLIQWVIPLFTETPELVVAGALVLSRRPAQGVALLLASSVIQSTLVLASISVAFLLGGGGSVLPLSGRERVEMMLTAATALMAVATMASLKPERVDGGIVAAAFGIQAVFPSWPVRLFVAWALLVFAINVLLSKRQFLRPIAATLRPNFSYGHGLGSRRRRATR